MNRNHGSDGGGEAAAFKGRPTGGRAGAEVIYVGRSSFWVERDIDLFQEMPESPWPTMEASAGGPQRDAETGETSAVAPVEAGVGVIFGINLSGPIILQAAADEPSRREDSNATPLPAGEVAFLPRPLRSRWSVLSPLTSLMLGTVIAFSLGLVVSPLGDAPSQVRSGARTTLPHGTGTAAVPQGIALVRPSDNAFRPLVVPSTIMGRPRVEAPVTAGRLPHSPAKREQPGLKLAIKHHAAKPKATPSPARVSAPPEADVITDGVPSPSRKSVDKESIDATKASGGDDENKASAKPWVDPWAD